jgi:transcriptional regulator
MYIPEHFRLEHLDDAAELVASVGAADVVTVDATGRPESTLLPILWDRAPSGLDAPYGLVLAHAARNNGQWHQVAPGSRALAIVRGPQAYISPRWYASDAADGRVVPTWNYSAVHLSGTVEVVDDVERVRGLVTRLTAWHEAGRRVPWTPESAEPAYLEGMLSAIVGVVLHVDRVEAKAKLGQNRSEADVAGAVEGLRAQGRAESDSVAASMQAARRR